MLISVSKSTFPSNFLKKMNIFGVNYDQENGAGASSDTKNALYIGFIAYMKPSSFLSLTTQTNKRPAKGFITYIKNGGSIASPVITYDSVEDRLVKHDGRRRIKAIFEIYGDIFVPVIVKLNDGRRAKDIDHDLIDSMNYYCLGEDGQTNSGFIAAYYSVNDKLVKL